MMGDTGQTSRWGLPLLAVGQMQKEVTHNEALALVDALLVPVVEGAPQNAPPPAPVAGQCWLVGSAPTGAWTGQAHKIACWTSGGWRWVAARARMTVRLADGRVAVFNGAAWILPGPLAVPTGGAIIDSEARAAIGVLIGVLRASGWVEPLP